MKTFLARFAHDESGATAIEYGLIAAFIGVGIIGLGYLLMSMGDVMGFVSLTLAPIVLCIGYLVVVPYGIMYGARAARKAREEKLTIDERTINDPAV